MKTQFTEETFFDWEKLKKEHPEATIRTISTDSHRIRIAFWGKIIGYRGAVKLHEFSRLHSILHPKERDKPCRLKERKVEKFSKGLSCPNCGTLNYVSKVNVYLKCFGCGIPLRSVKVRR